MAKTSTTTSVNEATARGVAKHDVSFRGLVGTIFWCLVTSIVVYLLGFATPGWQSISGSGDSSTKVGLWDVCICGMDDAAPWTSTGKWIMVRG